PSLTDVRERSAGRALWSSSGTLRCCAPCDRHAHPPALHRGDFGLGHRASSSDRRTISSRYPGSACALPFIQTSPSHSRRPPQRGRTMTVPPGTGLRAPPAGATPGSVNQASLEDALDEQGMPSVQGLKDRTREIRIRTCKVGKFCSFVETIAKPGPAPIKVPVR